MADRDFLVTLVGSMSDVDLHLGADDDALCSDVLSALKELNPQTSEVTIVRLQKQLRAGDSQGLRTLVVECFLLSSLPL